ncbi:MAG TPA: hypothetical protein VNE17_09045 [Nitrolancea sp.]|nr:hypothetical protein [Nitrolancea sp.]
MAVSVRTIAEPGIVNMDRSRLEQRASVLYLRLEDGYARIERALDDGQDITKWEDLWQRLLREYEQVSDILSYSDR